MSVNDLLGELEAIQKTRDCGKHVNSSIVQSGVQEMLALAGDAFRKGDVNFASSLFPSIEVAIADAFRTRGALELVPGFVKDYMRLEQAVYNGTFGTLAFEQDRRAANLFDACRACENSCYV